MTAIKVERNLIAPSGNRERGPGQQTDSEVSEEMADPDAVASMRAPEDSGPERSGTVAAVVAVAAAALNDAASDSEEDDDDQCFEGDMGNVVRPRMTLPRSNVPLTMPRIPPLEPARLRFQ